MRNMTSEIDGNSARFNGSKVVYSNLPPSILFKLAVLSEDSKVKIPYRGLNMLAQHYTLACVKYPDAPTGDGYTFPNWAKGQLFEAFVIDSMFRHLFAFLDGEIFDSDFGSHHMVSVAWGAAALHHFFSNYDYYQKFDDRRWVGYATSRYYNVADKPLTTVVLHNLVYVQTGQHIDNLLEALFQLFYAALLLAETSDVELSYKVDVKRLAKIKEKVDGAVYGEVRIAA